MPKKTKSTRLKEKNKSIKITKKRDKHQLLAVGVLVVGLVLVGVSARHLWAKSRVNQEGLVSQDVVGTMPVRIRIPGVLETEVVPGKLIKDNWPTADDAAVFLVDSALPGEMGNVVIYGHNKPQVLRDLVMVGVGRRVEMEMANGQTRVYQVKRIVEVTPDQVELLQPTDEEVLTLYTCSGLLDSKRWVVQAEPVVSE